MKSVKMYWVLILGIILSISFFVISCQDPDEPPFPSESDVYTHGVFIINEGPFQSGTGTITFMDRDGSRIENNLFQNSNNLIPLGNIVQSMTQSVMSNGSGGLTAFIAVNNANKVVVVHLNSFQSIYTIEDITLPRYIVHDGRNDIYISCWDNTVKIHNVELNEFIDEIEVGMGPEKMLKVGGQLYVLNQGGYDIDSTISVIDMSNLEKMHTIQVPPRPTGIQMDMNGDVWVMCSGRGSWHIGGESEGHLLKIDTSNFSIISDFAFPSITDHPENLVINSNRDKLFYFHNGGIFKFSVNATELESEPFISHSGFFYGLGLDHETDVLYASDALDFNQVGWVYRYNSTDGALIDSLKAGIAPGNFCFTNTF